MAVVAANVSVCQGFGNCVVSAPETFDVDDSGLVVVLRPAVTVEERPRVIEAVRSCPVSALRIEDT